jgi:hypothetical protein
MDLKSYFDRVFLVNLKRRPDRLAQINAALRKCDWPFKWPRVFAAVDGEMLPIPDGWQSGNGAWGCLRSHQQVLEMTLIEGSESVLILEDDACFIENFTIKVEDFLKAVPNDWDQLMLGGQHVNVNGTPKLIKPGIYRCTDCERTHCYAVRGEFKRKLYQRWTNGGAYNGEVHCDWIMGRDPEMQLKHNVYAPELFLVGQERGRSDINGTLHPRKYWNPPSPDLPVLNLHAPQNVVAALRQYGIHTGYNRDPVSDVDRGLLEVFKDSAGNGPTKVEKLAAWINEIQWEVASDPYLICTIWHQSASPEIIKEASRWPVHEVYADNLSEALNNLPHECRRRCRPSPARAHVIHLNAPKRVMDALRGQGWHNGFWRDRNSGLDNGLTRLCRESMDRDRRNELLAATIETLQREAETIYQGVAVIWHPEVDVEWLKSATRSKVVAIAARNIKDALDQWEDLRSAFSSSFENEPVIA